MEAEQLRTRIRELDLLVDTRQRKAEEATKERAEAQGELARLLCPVKPGEILTSRKSGARYSVEKVGHETWSYKHRDFRIVARQFKKNGEPYLRAGELDWWTDFEEEYSWEAEAKS